MVDLASYGEVVEQGDSVVKLHVPKTNTATVTGRVLADLPIDAVIELVLSQDVEG